MARATLEATVDPLNLSDLDRAVRLAGQVFACDGEATSSEVIYGRRPKRFAHLRWWASAVLVVCLMVWTFG